MDLPLHFLPGPWFDFGCGRRLPPIINYVVTTPGSPSLKIVSLSLARLCLDEYRETIFLLPTVNLTDG